ncbi:HTH domain-containing protein [Helicobacter pylori]|nr:HTH domain-containing protein [Helicobacter pylori]
MVENDSSKKWTRRGKRPIKARELAERFNISIRTVQRAWSQPREEYLANSLMRLRPWEKLGISRATWYRRGKPMPEVENGNANGTTHH